VGRFVKTWCKEINFGGLGRSDRFVHWYNDEHFHNGLRFVIPAYLHQGKDVKIIAQRQLA